MDNIHRTARSQVQTTQLLSKPIAQQTHLIPSTHVATWALCYTELKYTTSACRSTPNAFARAAPIHPSEPNMHEYPTDIHCRSQHNLASEPQFYSTTKSHSIYQPSPCWSIMPAPRSTLYPSKPKPHHPSTPYLVYPYPTPFNP